MMDRLPALDGLRAIAAILVVAFHVRLEGMSGGFIGVDIFFVLSGFLITALLDREMQRSGSIALARFWWRRLVRLYPALLLMLAGVAATGLYLGQWPAADVLLPALYLSDISQVAARQPVMTSHTWSLAVEMKFYLLWPLVTYLVLGRARRFAALIFLALYLLDTLWRILVFEQSGWVRAYYGFDTRVSGLLLGAALALIPWRPSPIAADGLATAMSLVLAAAVYGLHFYDAAAAGWGGAASEIAAFFLIMALTVKGCRVGALLAWRPLAHVGFWSYGLYLWHYPIARLTRENFDPPIAFALTLGLGLLLAAASYELVEKRLIRQARAAFTNKLAAA